MFLFKVLHALGFYHEHQRPDRDQHIQINWNAISQGAESQFLKMADRYLDSSFFSKYDLSKGYNLYHTKKNRF